MAQHGLENMRTVRPLRAELARAEIAGKERNVAVPRHIGLIPDGNRRWAKARGLAPESGYAHGVAPGLSLFELCRQSGIDELSVYGFTQDNTRRPARQTAKYREAVTEFAHQVRQQGAGLLVVGDDRSPLFPQELTEFRARTGGSPRVNLLVNYGWSWDLEGLRDGVLRSAQVSRIDLIVRWGGGRRLSGFLPVQSVYADIFVVDDLWPDFRPEHLFRALRWYAEQDRTLGG
jgi:undecaprenyl diphosphate synthase